MQEQKVTIDGGKSNITINIVIGGGDSASCGTTACNRGGSADKEIAAAVAAALEQYCREECADTIQHDKESFVLTIGSYQRISSPWGSKAITFRQRPPYEGPFSPLKMNPMRFRPEFR